MQSATLKVIDLIKKKDLINQSKSETKEVEVKDLGIFELRTPSIEDINNAQEFRGGGYEDDYLILNCCKEPDLRDKELLEAFEVVEPIEIINKIFKPGEKTNIARKLMDFAGFDDQQVKLVGAIKN